MTVGMSDFKDYVRLTAEQIKQDELNHAANKLIDCKTQFIEAASRGTTNKSDPRKLAQQLLQYATNLADAADNYKASKEVREGVYEQAYRPYSGLLMSCNLPPADKHKINEALDRLRNGPSTKAQAHQAADTSAAHTVAARSPAAPSGATKRPIGGGNINSSKKPVAGFEDIPPTRDDSTTRAGDKLNNIAHKVAASVGGAIKTTFHSVEKAARKAVTPVRQAWKKGGATALKRTLLASSRAPTSHTGDRVASNAGRTSAADHPDHKTSHKILIARELR